MKKITVTAIAVYTVFALTACATTKANKTVTLDQAIQEAAKNIENTVQAGQKIAVLNFTSPTEQFSAYVIDELSIQLANGRKVVVVDRRELDLIRQEEQFQLSGEVSDESALSIGKKLGAQFIVSGSLNAMGNAYRFRVRVLNVENAVVEVGSTADLNTGETKIAFMLSGAKPAPVIVQQPTPQPTPAPAVQPTPTPTPAPRPAPQPTPAPTPTPTQTPAPVQPAAPPQTPVPNNMVRINGGTFQMGSNSKDNEKPVHTVTITGFYMGKYEVTQKEWTAVMGSNPSNFKGDNLPVEQVSWFEAVDFCNRLSQKEGLTPAYTISGSGDSRTVTWNRNANGYRLPTEAEWEYTARGGNGSPGNYTYAGSNNADEVAWHYGNSGSRTHEVGTKKPNGLGLYDMSGNVSEWCWDWYGDYPSGAQNNPIGTSSGSSRVSRGGDWSASASAGGCRSVGRLNINPSGRTFFIGFRLARNGN